MLNKKSKLLFKTGIIGGATTLFLGGMISCNQQPLDFSWSGNVGDFVASYELYKNEKIHVDYTLTTYLSQQNTKEMLEQDLAYCICNNSKLMASNITFKLDIQNINSSNQRVSFYWIVQQSSIENEVTNIYEMQVSNLQYIPIIDNGSSGNNTLWFVPNNVSILNGTIIVDYKFWSSDPMFEILVNDYTTNKSYVFSYRQHDPTDQQEFEFTFSNFFVFSPFYYQNTQIIESE